MSDEIKHECAVALLRLLGGDGEPSRGGPLAGASDPGGTILSLLLEKQHNRGQDGAGAAVLSLSPEPGQPAWWIRKSASATALADLLGAIGRRPAAPGEALFLGHLRYATYGRGDESFCHPFVHAEPRLDRTIFLAGNFNLTNTHELFEEFRKAGNHPASTADGYLLCELLARALAEPGDLTTPSPISNAIASRRNSGRSPVRPATAASRPGGTGLRQDSASAETLLRIAAKRRAMREAFPPDGVAEQSRFCDPAPTILRALLRVLPKLDGAFTLCGMTGDGWAFAVRDAHVIRPGWFHVSPRAVAVASERPAIQAALDCPTDEVRELPPGEALLVSPAGEVRFERVLEPAEPRPCVFERIYFSRANDADIHRERKALGAALAAPLLRAVDFDLDHTFFSYIPNSAQVAFHGLLEALWTEGLAEGRPVRFGQVAVKDAKFRTFIADAAARREIGKHVYDVTYGLVRPGVDTLVVLDDSIVRGTTMRDAILPMLDRLGPRRIVVASSAPPIRYPDCYGIDMSTLGELVAFRALVNLLGDETEAELRAALETLSHAESAENAETSSFAAKRHPSFAPQVHPSFAPQAHPSFAPQAHPSFAPQAHPSFGNPLAALYARFTEEQHAAEIARMLTPPGMRADVSVVYQSVAALHAALVPSSQVRKFESSKVPNPLQEPANLRTCEPSNAREARFGDWYFTGDYPTSGGYRVLRRSLENHLARRAGRSY